MTWTRFMDMHSGGGTKEKPYEYIYIQAPQAEAEIIFYNRFGHNPNRVSCTCCGEDYSIDEETSLEKSTAFERGCAWRGREEGYVEEGDPKAWRPYQTIEAYMLKPDVLIIWAEDIKPEERQGELPRQGYIWCD